VTDELAVMVDTFHPLQLADTMDTIDDPAYAHSWSEPKA
jgi:homogentisate 1,2-dioxygenase